MEKQGLANELDDNTKNKKIILFDGVCNLCNASIDFLMKVDKKQTLYFSSLQSEFGQEILKKNNFSTEKFDSFLILDQGKLYHKSTAAIKTLSSLTGIWKLAKLFFIVPKPIRDYIYSLVANNRYRLFGKKDTCRLPTAEEKRRFI